MILVFGGTTEGRKAIKELEEAGNTYFYSTKTGDQQVTLHHGVRVDGAMDDHSMEQFCKEHHIRLLVDAAHPFAERLHQTVAVVAERLRIPAIRFERIFPESDDAIEWFDNLEQFTRVVDGLRGKLLLATTGVQTIAKLRAMEEKGVRIMYRILPRESSVSLARRQGVSDTQLCYYHEGEDELRMLEELHPDAVLMKESGLTGGFCEKVEAAKALNIRAFSIRRPATPRTFKCVDGEHGLRRMVEKLLPEFYPLHSGLTTGTYATASALAGTIRLLRGETPAEVFVTLPNGEHIPVPVFYDDDGAYTIKDSGDDPDITKGIEIRASVVRVNNQGDTPQIDIVGGEGIGTITLPGFDYPPGEPAINKVPRQMIRGNLMQIITDINPIHASEKAMPDHRQASSNISLRVTISVPEGREIAKKTFNPRLGIVDGISIVGVSGIIKPFSEEGFLNSIRKCMEVAKATGYNHVVINSGAKSERFVKASFPDLPPQVFVEYGNYIGATIKIADELAISHVSLGVMMGKAVKLAAGHLDTHSRRTVMDKVFIDTMLEEAGCNEEVREKARLMTLARELWEIVPADQLERFASVVKNRCLEHCAPLLPQGELSILLINEDGRVF